MKFELTILGCGSAVPSSKRNSAAQVLNVLERYFLIDCGEGTQHQLRRFGIPYSKISHIFISHLHGDHFFGLIGLLSTYSLQGRRGDLHIYGDSRLQDIIEMQLKLMNCRLGYGLIFHRLLRETEVIFEDNVVTVTSFPLKHRYDAPVCGFLFREKERERTVRRDMAEAWQVPLAFMQHLKKGADYVTPEGEIVANRMLTYDPPRSRSYAYMTDTLYRERFAEYVKEVDLLYHEATYGHELVRLAKETFHSTAEQAARLAQEAGAGKLLLGHFSSRYTDPDCLLPEARAIFPQTYVCADGDVYDVAGVPRKNDGTVEGEPENHGQG